MRESALRSVPPSASVWPNWRATGVSPLHKRMPIFEGLGDLGVPPFRADHPLDVVSEEIGESLPGGRPVDGVPHRDELVAILLPGDDRPAQPLLVFADTFGSLM